ncbi:Endoribonuclease Dicer homolog 2 [Linum perenne]
MVPTCSLRSQDATRLLEPLVTPEKLRLEPVRELNELCQREHLAQSTLVVVREDGVTSITMQVEANNGVIFSHTASEKDKKMAKRLASREILKALRESGILKT